ncbi:MAG: tetratricopeptide repeat protein [Deltaproteobacteria bacterium]|nr:tetratricopeptide repeat protein [Deltaproteobacteria bacterium]
MRGLLVLAFVMAGAPALAEDTDTAQAKKLFVLATTNYELGRFDDALRSYLEAYQRKPLPGFLFNIGLCHRKLGDHVAAVAAFEEYLAKVPKAQNRADVEAMLAEERAAAAAAPPPTPPPVVAEPAPPPPPAAAVAPVAPEQAPPPSEPPAGDDGGTWVWAAAGGAVLVAAAAGTVAAVAFFAQPATTPPATTQPLARVDLRTP